MNNFNEKLEDNVALVDLDGTIADYDKSMKKYMDLLKSPNEIDYSNHYDDVPSYIEARRRLIKNQPGFWRNLPRLELGFDIVELLIQAEFELVVLTKGPKRVPAAWQEKVEWCTKYLPEASITVTQNKSLTYGKILVDDFPDYFMGWLKARPRGLVITVAHPWNAEVQHPNVIRYDGTNTDQIRDAIHAARDRVSGEDLKL